MSPWLFGLHNKFVIKEAKTRALGVGEQSIYVELNISENSASHFLRWHFAGDGYTYTEETIQSSQEIGGMNISFLYRV